MLSQMNSAFGVNLKNELDHRGTPTENYSSRGLKLTLETEKGRFTSSDKIPVELNLSNNGIYPISIYLERDFRKNFKLIARDETGQSLPLVEPSLERTHQTNDDLYFYRNFTGNKYNVRRIILQPGENFTRSINLSDSVHLRKHLNGISNLQINAFFYPNVEQQAEFYIASHNELSIFVDYNLHPDKQPETSLASIQKPLGLDAKEIVFLTLTAEYTGDWENYFKYISLPDLIRDYPVYARDYIRSEPFDRPRVIRLFKEYLRDEKNQKLLRFRVLSDNKSQQSNSSGATVKARVTRIMEGLEREYNYTFFLTRKDNLWLITGLQSELLG